MSDNLQSRRGYQEYLEKVATKWNNQRIQRNARLSRDLSISGYPVDLFGYNYFFTQATMGLDGIFAISRFMDVEVDDVRRFTSVVTEYAASYDNLRSGTVGIIPNSTAVFPILVCERFNEAPKAFTEGFDGRGPGSTWSRSLMQHPVLSELSSKQIYHNVSLPGVWWAKKKAVRDLANNYFRF